MNQTEMRLNTELFFLYVVCAFITNAFCFSTNNSRKVIIIGAGPSGIAAAARLYENNVKDILILEAENRIGGRINTVKVSGKLVPVDNLVNLVYQQ